jgi:hypothetical protein
MYVKQSDILNQAAKKKPIFDSLWNDEVEIEGKNYMNVNGEHFGDLTVFRNESRNHTMFGVSFDAGVNCVNDWIVSTTNGAIGSAIICFMVIMRTGPKNSVVKLFSDLMKATNVTKNVAQSFNNGMMSAAQTNNMDVAEFLFEGINGGLPMALSLAHDAFMELFGLKFGGIYKSKKGQDVYVFMDVKGKTTTKVNSKFKQ